MERYRGKVALVTGASAGIGACIAARLAKTHGMKVVACARRLERLESMQKSLGESFIPYRCDLTQFDQVKTMLEWIEKTFARLDVVVNNAGMIVYSGILDQSPKDWERMTDLNLIAASYVTQLASKLMLKSQLVQSGNIIFINSMAGHIENDNPLTSMYNATKFSLTSLIESWRVELSGSKSKTKIRVGSISPGLTETEVVLAAFPDNPGFSKHIFASYPNIKVEDMADLVDYLLETSEHVQMQDLKVTHVHSGIMNQYSDGEKNENTRL